MSRQQTTITIEEIKDRLTPFFKEEGLQLVIIFGSAVTGNAHKHSDIDIACLFDRSFDILAITNQVIKLLRTDNIDVVDLKRSSPLLKYSAVKNGCLIYEKEDGIFNEFYSLAFRMYVDTKKLRDAQATSIKYFLKERELS